MTPPDAQTRLIGGRYRLEEPIGRGGMGTVWRGYDEVLSRPVAIKEVRFPPELGEHEQAELRQRTLREARATASLSHPNVVTTYDVVEEDGLPYIVMELLHARSLSDILRDDGPLPPHRVAQIGLQMLAALELSHRTGVVHRDVKPGNVLLTDDGRAILTDFGIATVAGDPSLTSTGVMLGSPAYMSPERARGKKPGAAADLWSLGATLYAATEGRPPYDGGNALGTLTSVISDPVPPPRVGGPLADAILGLLQKEPAERMSIPRTRALLEAAAVDRSVPAAATTVAAAADLDRTSRTEALPRPRSSAWVVIALLALLAVLAVLGWAVMRDDNPTPTGNDPSTTPSTTAPASTTPSSTPSNTRPPGVPAGYTLYEDPSGFSVAVPDGWEPVRDGSIVEFREPGGERFLRVDQTDHPRKDPERDWEQQEKQAKDDDERFPNYEGLGIDSVDYRDYKAADWEFTFGDDDPVTHVLNRGMNTGRMGYALYFSSPDDQWDESESIRDTIFDTFQPAG